MRVSSFLTIFISIIASLTNLYSNDFQKGESSEPFNYLNFIISEAREIFKYEENDKLYLNEDTIYQTNDEILILTSDNSSIPIHRSYIFSDTNGYYVSLTELKNKPFKNVCLDCKFEWTGGVFTIRCPKCHSRNIINVPNPDYPGNKP